jgi:type II secretory pathway pseudopilin PulG
MVAGRRDSAGFGLVEVVIATLLLGVIAVFLLPALWQGIIVASQQSSTASATRLLNSRIEEARAEQSCESIAALDDVRTPPPSDGNGSPLTVSFVGGSPSCAGGATVSFALQVTDLDGVVLSSTSAIVYVP